MPVIFVQTKRKIFSGPVSPHRTRSRPCPPVSGPDSYRDVGQATLAILQSRQQFFYVSVPALPKAGKTLALGKIIYK